MNWFEALVLGLVQGRSLHIRHPRENLSIAENFLYMMKHENYSELMTEHLSMTR